MEGLAGAFAMSEVVILGFQDWIKACALEADLVMSFAGASVAIDRANCLLMPVVVASYFKVSQISSHRKNLSAEKTCLGRRYPQRTQRLAEAPNSLSSHV